MDILSIEDLETCEEYANWSVYRGRWDCFNKMKVELGCAFDETDNLDELTGFKQDTHSDDNYFQELISYGLIMKAMLAAKKTDEEFVSNLMQEKIHIFDFQLNLQNWNKHFDMDLFKNKLQTLNSVAKKYES